MNGKNTKPKEIDSLYFVPDNFLFPNIFSSIFIKKGQIQQNSAPPYIISENTTKFKFEIIIWMPNFKDVSCDNIISFKGGFWFHNALQWVNYCDSSERKN